MRRVVKYRKRSVRICRRRGEKDEDKNLIRKSRR